MSGARRTRGQPRIDPDSPARNLTVRVPDALRAAVQERADAEGIGLGEAVREALEEWAATTPPGGTPDA